MLMSWDRKAMRLCSSSSSAFVQHTFQPTFRAWRHLCGDLASDEGLLGGNPLVLMLPWQDN